MLTPIEVQRLASDPDYSVYVAASAGTGKTKILCDRFLRLMLNGSPPENILCVTFTNAAAAEMEERIRLSLKKWKELSQNELKEELEKLNGVKASADECRTAQSLYDKFLQNLSRVKIQTLHSLCMDILQYYVNTDNPNNGKIIDTFMRRKYIKESFTKVINQNENGVFLKTVANYYDFDHTLKLVSQLIGEKAKLMDYRAGHVTPAELKADVYAQHGANLDSDREKLKENFWQDLPMAIKYCGERLANLTKPQLINAINAKNFKEYKNFFFTQTGEPRKKLLPRQYEDQYPADLQSLETELQRITHYQALLNSLITSEANYALFSLAIATLDDYEVRKTHAGLVEYEDLLLNTINLLENSELAATVLHSLDYRIDHILVDEAQDLSLKQWQVINLISEEFFAGEGARKLSRTIFIVGDYKQSIYSFQGAEPAIFLKMKNYYKQRVEAAEKKWREVELSHSFRTTLPVLKSVDKIFATNHIAFRSGSGHVELLELITKDKEQTKTDDWKFPQWELSKQSSKYTLADNLAKMISSWLKEGRMLAGHKRTIAASDIMILVRKRSDFTKILGSSLAQYHIPYVNQDHVKLSQELIVQDLIALANFILLPIDDFNLACLLKSPLIDCNDEDLFNFAFNRKGALYQELDEKTRETLNHYTKLAEQLPIYEFFSTILECHDKRLNFVRRFGKRANFILDQFLEAALTFEQNYIGTLPTFIEWLQKGGGDENAGQFHADDCLRIMTVHSAKGLQAPIIILADAASSEQTPLEQIYWHDGRPYLSILRDLDSEKVKKIRDIYKKSQEAESMRLLYVAMTRAEDELYIAGWENQYINASWYKLLCDNITNTIASKDYSHFEESKTQAETVIPKFIREKFLTPKSINRTLTVTEPANIKTFEMLRGEVLHDLLAKLPLVSNQNDYLKEVQKNFSQEFSDEEFNELKSAVLKVIDKFPQLFGKNSFSEVPLTGYSNDNYLLNARIDKLVFEGNTIQIIDFKSDHNRDHINQYRQQLRAYESLIRTVYPDKKIESYILWIQALELTKA
jgi:ATP-dependent helicase/nuclease subunit A